MRRASQRRRKQGGKYRKRSYLVDSTKLHHFRWQFVDSSRSHKMKKVVTGGSAGARLGANRRATRSRVKGSGRGAWADRGVSQKSVSSQGRGIESERVSERIAEFCDSVPQASRGVSHIGAARMHSVDHEETVDVSACRAADGKLVGGSLLEVCLQADASGVLLCHKWWKSC